MYLRSKDYHEAVHMGLHSAFGIDTHAFDLNRAYRAMVQCLYGYNRIAVVPVPPTRPAVRRFA